LFGFLGVSVILLIPFCLCDFAQPFS
jgi:hypothetical protein